MRRIYETLLGAGLATGLTLGATGCGESNNKETAALAPNPAVIKTLGKVVRGTINDGSGPMSFSFEQVQYYTNGTRDVTYADSAQDVYYGRIVDEFEEGCFSDNPTSLKPGQQFDISDDAIHSGGPVQDSRVCADERVTPADFASDPYALGEPSVVTVDSVLPY